MSRNLLCLKFKLDNQPEKICRNAYKSYLSLLERVYPFFPFAHRKYALKIMSEALNNFYSFLNFGVGLQS